MLAGQRVLRTELRRPWTEHAFAGRAGRVALAVLRAVRRSLRLSRVVNVDAVLQSKLAWSLSRAAPSPRRCRLRFSHGSPHETANSPLSDLQIAASSLALDRATSPTRRLGEHLLHRITPPWPDLPYQSALAHFPSSCVWNGSCMLFGSRRIRRFNHHTCTVFAREPPVMPVNRQEGTTNKFGASRSLLLPSRTLPCHRVAICPLPLPMN